jgi:hypothetical protein
VPFETFFPFFSLIHFSLASPPSDPFSYLKITLPDTVSEYYFIFSFLESIRFIELEWFCEIVVGDPAQLSSHPRRIRLFVWLLSLSYYFSFFSSLFFSPFLFTPDSSDTNKHRLFPLGSNLSRTSLILYYIQVPVPVTHIPTPIILHSSSPFFCFRRKGSSSIFSPCCLSRLSCIRLST